jgi:hypothetical protein
MKNVTLFFAVLFSISVAARGLSACVINDIQPIITGQQSQCISAGYASGTNQYICVQTGNFPVYSIKISYNRAGQNYIKFYPTGTPTTEQYGFITVYSAVNVSSDGGNLQGIVPSKGLVAINSATACKDMLITPFN